METEEGCFENEETLNINLPTEKEGNLIEEYLKDDEKSNNIIGISYQQSNEHILNLQNYPEQFFNFGFTTEDFKVYLLKHLYLRVEKALIVQAVENFKNSRIMK